MNITLRREVLLDSIMKIIATCERSSQSSRGASLPHFFYIRVEGYGNSIRLSAHNMYRRIEVMIGEVTEHDPFSVGVPGEQFAALIKNIYEDKVQLIIGGDEGLYLKVVTSGSSYKIAALDNDRFPEQEVVTIKTWQEVSFETLFDCFSRIIYCSASDDTDRSYAKSVCVTDDSFFCTDGYRLSLYPNRIIRCERPILIPIESVRSFSNLFKEGGHEGFVYVEEQRLQQIRDKITELDLKKFGLNG